MSSRISSVRDAIEKSLYDEKHPWTKYFQMVEEKTNMKRFNIFVGLVAFIAFYLVFGYGPQLLCNLIGFGYPAYCSMKAVESPQKDDDTKWLTYWVVFSTFSIAEYFSNVICNWIPVYWLLKCFFLLWCFLPLPLNGSIFLYNNYIRPYFLKHQSSVDSVLGDLANKGISKATKIAASVKGD
ncbi:Receptor expression-enhancing protein, putative [Pediculus humanus corporis]|uniref:Receptor expression-enhancing protein n=1 Tax=Pediculus humanus subsp. corporis TaxID=121224 RepID=E0VH70_PEDHC|nr:Receptor expression-enhancing protein, putative [Pediculus humanus corporis]EEB12726.1 Receptor expression-enhancing protein, putative [Pediculus humanus corporis]